MSCAQPRPLHPGRIHVWRGWLDPERAAEPSSPALSSGALLASAEAVLDDEERARANRFRFDHLRRRFILARCHLRQLLGEYLDCPASAIQFAYGEHGKPRLADVPEGGSGLHFNVSHSGDVALFAFATDLEIGVDVEQVNGLRNAAGIAERHFSPREFENYLTFDEGARVDAFFQCWTRKEAFIKAMGNGISYGLDRFEVDFGPDRPVRLLTIRGDEEVAAAWQMTHLEPHAGFVGAVAASAAFEFDMLSVDGLPFPGDESTR